VALPGPVATLVPGVTIPSSRYARPMDIVEAANATTVDRGAVTMRLSPDGTAPVDDPSVRLVVTDTTSTPTSTESPGPFLIRDVAERVLAERDLFAEARDHLDAWATASGIVETMAVEGTSFWYYIRLGQWMWLVDRLLDAAIVDALLVDLRPSTVEVDPGVAPGIAAAARAAAARDGHAFHGPDRGHETGSGATDSTNQALARPPTDAPAGSTVPLAAASGSVVARVLRRLGWVVGRRPVDENSRRRAIVAARLERLAAGPGRLLVVLAHARQRVETADGSRMINPYLGPIEEALRGSRIDPIGIETGVHIADPAWERIESDEHLLPGDALPIALQVEQRATRETSPDQSPRDQAEAILQEIAAIATPLVVDGVDLAPELVGRIIEQARRILAGKIRGYHQIRSLIRRVRPSGVLLADEYHRQEWLAAARAEGIPSAAVQHGLIYRWHNGYIHRYRPASLRLPDRTYVFGDWERRLLTSSSVYLDSEVTIGGSPRLDLVRTGAADAAAMRTQLGVAEGDRLVVLSGTWGPLYRTYLYPIALARLFDRPLPRVHLVVKLHPSEQDEGPYRAVIEGVALAAGFAPPPVTVVQDVDLYGLLAAADAHLGIHSTVLTEAVVTGTPNLIADHARNADLLGYVEAGVATPVRTGADLLRALDTTRDSEAAVAARHRFLEDHFEPGCASERIAADLLAWLP
jgi:hypothetical protein